MARIRNIKPTFFEDTKIAALPILARLLYIGLWCHMDKFGVVENCEQLIRARLFPYDKKIADSDIRKAISALVASKRLIEFEFDGVRLLFCPKFSVHQHFHHKEKPQRHIPQELLYSLGLQRGETETSPGQVAVEPLGNLKSEIRNLNAETEPPIGSPISAEGLVQKFNTVCTSLPAVKKLTAKRRRLISAALRDNPEPEFWDMYLGKAASVKFLNGDNDRGWRANLDWLMKSENQIKVLEGNYDQPTSKKHKQGLVL